MERIVCSSLECYSTAVARSKITGKCYCAQCAVRLSGQFGVATIETIEGGGFPWDFPPDKKCPYCGADYNMHITAHTGGCPSCKKSIEEIQHA